jgi:hypothetical protein
VSHPPSCFRSAPVGAQEHVKFHTTHCCFTCIGTSNRQTEPPQMIASSRCAPKLGPRRRLVILTHSRTRSGLPGGSADSRPTAGFQSRSSPLPFNPLASSPLVLHAPCCRCRSHLSLIFSFTNGRFKNPKTCCRCRSRPYRHEGHDASLPRMPARPCPGATTRGGYPTHADPRLSRRWYSGWYARWGLTPTT